MDREKRRKPVIPISGESVPDFITQAELRKCLNLQMAVWSAERAAHRQISRLVARITAGAEIEDGRLKFDKELKKVRDCE